MLTSTFYQIGGTLSPESKLYITRQADSELLRLCRQGLFAYILAPRQIGKSSLMVRTAYELQQEGILSVKIDLSGIGKDQVTPEQWYYGFLREIITQLELSFQLKAWWHNNDELGVTQRFTLFFEEILLKEVNNPIIIFVDEIDTTLGLDFTDDFYAAIRSLYVARASRASLEKLSFVLIGVATPGDLVRDVRRTPFNIGQRVEMTDFTYDEALPLANGLNFPEEETRQILKWILKWTGGHPYLTQSLCQAVQVENRLSWSEAELDQLVHATFLSEEKSRTDNNLQFVRDMLTRRAPDREAVLFTYRKIRRGRQAVVDEEQSVIKSHLKLSGVVKRSGSFLRVRNLIYRTVFDEPWIKGYLPVNWGQRIRQAALPLAIVLILAIVMGTLAIYAFIQQGEAESQRNLAKEQAAQAQRQKQSADAQRLALQGQLLGDPQVGMLLAAEAADQIIGGGLEDVNHLTESALRQTILNYNPNRLFTGPHSAVTGVAISPDGQLLAATSAEGTGYLWKISDGQLLAILHHPSGTMNGVAFSPHGKYLLTTGDRYAYLWEATTGKELRQVIGMDQGGRSSLVSFSPDSTRMAIINPDLQIVDTVTGQVIVNTGKEGDRIDLAFSPDGKLMAVASEESVARVFEAKSGKLIFTLPHKALVNRLTFSPDSKYLATIEIENKAVFIWDLSTGQKGFELTGHEATVDKIIYSPDGRWIVTSGEDLTARLWEASTGRPVSVMRSDQGLIDDVLFSPDSQTLFTSGHDQTIRAWTVPSGKELVTLRGHTAKIGYNQQQGQYGDLAFSRDGRYLASGSDDTTVRLWDWELIRNQKRLFSGLAGSVSSVAFSPDGKRLAATTPSARPLIAATYGPASIYLWNWLTGQQEKILSGHFNGINTVTFSPGGNTLLSASGDSTVRTWDVATGQQKQSLAGNRVLAAGLSKTASGEKGFVLAYQDKSVVYYTNWNHTGPVLDQLQRIPLNGHSAEVNDISFSSDDRYIVTASADRTARIWLSGTGKLVQTLVGHTAPVRSAEFSPDGSDVVTAGEDGTARLWEVKSGRELAVLQGHQGPVNRAVFSSDGHLILTSGSDQTARIWNARPGLDGQLRELAVITGHSALLHDAIFSPDGKQIFTAGEDGAILVWNVIGLKSGAVTELKQPLAVLKGHNGPVNRLILSLDGKLLISGGEDGQVISWNITTNQLAITVRFNPGPVLNMTIDQDNVVVSASSSGSPIGIDILLGRPLGIIPSAAPTTGAAYSPAGSLIATSAEDGLVKIYQGTTGQLLRTWPAHKDLAVLDSQHAFTPDGQLLVTTGGDNTIRLWKVTNGQVFREIKAQATTVRFSPDGKYVLTTENDHTVRVYEVNSGRIVHELKHDLTVSSAAFSQDERFVLTGTAAGKVRLWDFGEGRELATVAQLGGSVLDVEFSPDSKYFAVAGEDREVQINACEVCASFRELVAIAKNKSNRPLTEDERTRYGVLSTLKPGQ